MSLRSELGARNPAQLPKAIGLGDVYPVKDYKVPERAMMAAIAKLLTVEDMEAVLSPETRRRLTEFRAKAKDRREVRKCF